MTEVKRYCVQVYELHDSPLSKDDSETVVLASAYDALAAKLAEAEKLLRQADDLYTNYGLVAGKADGLCCGKWIGDVRDFVRK